MKKYILFCLFKFFIPLFLVAQESRIDSLKQVLKNCKEDTNKVKTLNQITSIYLQSPPNYKKALPFAEDSRLVAEKISFKKGAAVAYENLGAIYGYFGLYEKVFENYLKGLKVWEIFKDSAMIIRSYNNIAFAYSLQANFKKALEIHLMLEKIIESKGEMENFSKTLWGLSGVYKNYCRQIVQQGDSVQANYNYDKAIEYAQRALKISENTMDSVGMAYFYNTLGLLYDKCNLCEESFLIKETNLIRGNHYHQAEEYFFKALDIYIKLNKEEGVLEEYSHLGLFLQEPGKFVH